MNGTHKVKQHDLIAGRPSELCGGLDGLANRMDKNRNKKLRSDRYKLMRATHIPEGTEIHDEDTPIGDWNKVR